MSSENNRITFEARMAEHARAVAEFWGSRAAADFAAMDRARAGGRHISAVMYQKTGAIAAAAAMRARGLCEEGAR